MHWGSFYMPFVCFCFFYALFALIRLTVCCTYARFACIWSHCIWIRVVHAILFFQCWENTMKHNALVWTAFIGNYYFLVAMHSQTQLSASGMNEPFRLTDPLPLLEVCWIFHHFLYMRQWPAGGKSPDGQTDSNKNPNPYLHFVKLKKKIDFTYT